MVTVMVRVVVRVVVRVMVRVMVMVTSGTPKPWLVGSWAAGHPVGWLIIFLFCPDRLGGSGRRSVVASRFQTHLCDFAQAIWGTLFPNSAETVLWCHPNRQVVRPFRAAACNRLEPPKQ